MLRVGGTEVEDQGRVGLMMIRLSFGNRYGAFAWS
jgi:hypothetical protein